VQHTNMIYKLKPWREWKA